MKRLRNWGGLGISLASVLMAACFTEAGGPDEDLDESEGALTRVIDVDFESYPAGRVASPWTVTSAGATTVSVASTADHGNVLLLHGGRVSPDYIIAALGLSSSSPEISARVDINPAGDASFIWSLHGAGSSIGKRRIRLQREPGANVLIAHTVPGGNTACGTLALDTWSTVTLNVHAQQLPHTFDVLINGARTSCTGLPTGLSPPFRSVNVMDASNQGWGGDVRFDNIAVTTP